MPVDQATKITNTIRALRACAAARDAGIPVAFTSDIRWLLNMAMNRRAGWPEADRHTHGIAYLNHRGQLARKWAGDWQRHVYQFAMRVNTPRLIVRLVGCPEAREFAGRLAHRLTMPEDEE